MKNFLKNYGALVLILAALLLGLLGGRYIYQQFRLLNERLDSMSAASYRLEEQLSLTETKGLMRRHWVYYGDVDQEARTVQVYVSLVPQVYDVDTQVSVVCNGETLPVPWDNGAYRVQLDAPLDTSCKITELSVAQGDKVERVDLNWELMDDWSSPRGVSTLLNTVWTPTPGNGVSRSIPCLEAPCPGP